MRFLLDQCVPNRVAKTLAVNGHEVVCLRECLPTDSADPIVLRMASSLDAVLVSLNGDFSDITAYPPAQHRGVVALQFKNRPEAIEPTMERLIIYFRQHAERRDMDGKLLLIEPHRIRIRV